MRASKFKSIVRGMAGRRIAVLGDLVVDEYVFGETERISREAPVLILKYRGRHIGLGGASNAVANIAAFGGSPIPIGFIGDDENGRSLIDLFKQKDIPANSIIIEKNFSTVSKTRIIAGGMHTVRQQIVRIDREPDFPPDPKNIIEHLSEVIESGIDGLLVSDYGCGVLSPDVVRFINKIARTGKIRIAIDSRFQLLRFRHAALAAPNEEEANIHTGIGADDIAAIDKAGKRLRRLLNSRGLLITRGSEGISLFEQGEEPVHLPVFGSRAAVDTTGAGDTVVTAALLTLCAGASYMEAAEIANRAGGLTVMKKGAATVSPEELLATL
jgi:D-glycero-beta-D-manno-heptose-7-phosphate kinase